MIETRRALAIMLGAWLSAGAALATDHPLHSSHAVVEFNAETSSFEVSLCLFPDDLSQALSRRAGHTVAVETDSDMDSLLARYTDEEFQLRFGKEPRRPLKWLGYELESQQVWLYFEFPIDEAAPTDVKIKNTVFMDQFDDQINIAYVRIGGRQRCLSFRTDTPSWLPWIVTREQSEGDSTPTSPPADPAVLTTTSGPPER